MTGEVLSLITINVTLLITIIFVLWALAVRINDVSFIDSFWALGMVILSWSAWLNSGQHGGKPVLLLALVTIWGLRLFTHLFTRWRAEGEDPRYTKIIGGVMQSKGWSWSQTALIMVFLMQAPLLFITCLPAQIGIIYGGTAPEIDTLSKIGAAIAMAGIIFESVGDAQLKSFRKNPDNKGKVMDKGLWRYTRHPNYFGDFCTWWGIWLIAASMGMAIALITVIGPIFLSFTLMRWSGGPMLERALKKNRPLYSDYIARTSGFFPWPPKKN